MKMDGQIRVKTEGKYKRLYNDLKNVVVGDFHELFYVCACLGYKNNRTKPLSGSKDDRDRFWSNTITPREWACYYAMLLEKSDMDFYSIQDDKTVLAKIEEYANAGMDMLIEDFLKMYLHTSRTELQLDGSASKELPKHFLNYIFEQIENDFNH